MGDAGIEGHLSSLECGLPRRVGITQGHEPARAAPPVLFRAKFSLLNKMCFKIDS
jgi:hypothetical protein